MSFGQNLRRTTILFLFTAAVLLADWLLILPDNLFGRSVQNALHIPAFFVFTLLLHWLYPTWRLIRLLAVALSVGIGMELVQAVTPRDASLMDLLRNLLGVILALLMVAALTGTKSRSYAVAAACGLITIMLAASAAEPARYLLAYQYRDNQFPILLSPNAWQLTPLLTGRTGYQWRSISTDEAVALGLGPDARVLSVVMNQDQYPGVTLQETVGNWACYGTLSVRFLIHAPAAIPLRVAVGYVGTPGTAAFVYRDVPPGLSTWRIPITDLLADTSSAPQVSHIIVYSSPTAAGAELLLADLMLSEPLSPIPPGC